MTYDSFLKCFKRVKVCNLRPEMKINVSPKEVVIYFLFFKFNTIFFILLS